MDWLEMHNLEFGECTVLGSLEGNILMVDCEMCIRDRVWGLSRYIQ